MFGGCLPPSVTLCHVCQRSAQQKRYSCVPIKDASVSLEIVLIVPSGLCARWAPLASSSRVVSEQHPVGSRALAVVQVPERVMFPWGQGTAPS